MQLTTENTKKAQNAQRRKGTRDVNKRQETRNKELGNAKKVLGNWNSEFGTRDGVFMYSFSIFN